jgi:putative ABC transport system ATP-binding protein
MPSPLIDVSALSKSVLRAGEPPLRILEGVSFSIEAGESVAIVGASGSGKSTLLGLLAGLDEPSSGDIRIQGRSLIALNEEGRAALRASMLGFVFQSFQLLPGLTALENVMLPLELASAPDARTKALHWLDRVGLGKRVHHTPRQLSGGEQQRVALARAFVTSPALLLADEPTGNLDARTGESIVKLLFALNEETGTTLVLVTHDNALARRCARQLTLEEGRLLAHTGETLSTPLSR